MWDDDATSTCCEQRRVSDCVLICTFYFGEGKLASLLIKICHLLMWFKF